MEKGVKCRHGRRFIDRRIQDLLPQLRSRKRDPADFLHPVMIHFFAADTFQEEEVFLHLPLGIAFCLIGVFRM